MTNDVSSPAGGGPLAKPGSRWWIDEPIRMALFLYNQYDAPVDTDHFVDRLVELGANAVILPMAGIAAYYPTDVPFHTRAPSLPPGRDLVGEIVEKAHAKGIYVVGRFEWTVHQNHDVLRAHPDWVQRDASGESPLWNDAYAMCLNGGYMQEHSFKIMEEALDRYPIDGMFFNYGGGQRNVFGACHCDNCRALFQSKYGRNIPAQTDADYLSFMEECTRTLATRIGDYVRGRRPGINFMVGDNADSTNSETHSAPIATSQAYWLYDASETVNRARSAHPERMQFNNDAVFVDGRWRFSHRSAPDGEIRAYQNMANGAGPYLFVNGTVDQFDRQGENGARPAFHFHRAHEDHYVRQENAARVLLIDEPRSRLTDILFTARQEAAKLPEAGNGGFGYNDGIDIGSGLGTRRTSLAGFFRLLSEQHVPFVLSSDLSWVDSDPGRYDLVISPSGAKAKIGDYLRQGGRALIAGAERPDLDLPATVKRWSRKETHAAYWRIRDRKMLPSLGDADVMFFYSDYLELEPTGLAPLTLIPPTPVNPMEKVGEGMVDTDRPGLLVKPYGQGELAYIPWNIGDLYYRAGAPLHAALVGDLVDHLLPGGRQIRTNAHPMVQITLQRQAHKQRTLVHFVNLSGASQVAYHPAIPMNGIQVQVQGAFSAVQQLSESRALSSRHADGYTSFTLPTLDTYDVVVLSD